ncbi:MAG: IreB family regulatory phosphoprotein [Clostridia bacterium]|nr:IreB family regulatory phosphoprotein [Clostridia bacterium]
MDNKKTIVMDAVKEERTTRDILQIVYDSLNERGYNAVDQMVGYILSGDPSYITSYNNARNLIGKIDRDDLVEELLNNYLEK